MLWCVRAWQDKAVERGFLDANVIAIGGDEVGDLSDRPSDSEIAKAIRQGQPDRSARALPILIGYWRRFLDEMSTGDLVLVPMSGDRVAVGEITGGYEYRHQDVDAHLRHTRTVRWLRTCDRATLGPEFQTTLKSRHTLREVTLPDAEVIVRRRLRLDDR